MRMVMWTFTILFVLAGLALRADGGFGVPTAYDWLSPYVAQGLFILAALACPLLWAPRYRLVPQALALSGGQRMMLALALLLATPLLLPWPF